MTNLVIHPATQLRLEAFTATPSHALLLVGPSGSGKLSLAHKIAETVLGIPKAIDYPYGLFIAPIDGTISIDEIRKLEKFVSLKVPGSKTMKRLILIEQAEKLTIEAQNALLKNLEEPPADTIVILTASHAGGMLPTIRSRVQTIIVGQPERQALHQQFADTDAPTFDRAYMMSGGRPGLLTSILTDVDHPLEKATEYARKILGENVFNRLLIAEDLSKSREMASNVTLILQHMAHISLQNATGAAFKRWEAILAASYVASEALNSNGQTKLVLLNLMLNL